jgi:hypothetical protein
LHGFQVIVNLEFGADLPIGFQKTYLGLARGVFLTVNDGLVYFGLGVCALGGRSCVRTVLELPILVAFALGVDCSIEVLHGSCVKVKLRQGFIDILNLFAYLFDNALLNLAFKRFFHNICCLWCLEVISELNRLSEFLLIGEGFINFKA